MQKNTTPRGGKANYRNDYTTGSDPVRQFADAVYRDTGATIDPIPDGEIHRFSDPEGRARNDACWYLLHLDGLPAGAYGNWRAGVSKTWRASTDKPISPEEREHSSALMRTAKAEREAIRTKEQTEARHRAIDLWEQAKPAADHHPYLAAKRVPALGLRQIGDLLLVPLRTVDNDLVNLQTILPDGTKRFLKDGKITDAFCLVGAAHIPEGGTLYIAEGFATAATVAQALMTPAVAAMNASNLKPVAQAIHARYPRQALVMAADNDWRTHGNPGVTKAREAAAAVGGHVTWPHVCMKFNCPCTDFNDLKHCRGVDR